MDIHAWLTQTKASEVMVDAVATVWPTHTLAQVAAVLLRENVSGVPVVDQEDKCVGVFSVMDVLRAEETIIEERMKTAQSAYFTSELALPVSVYAEQLQQVRDKLAPAAEQPVERFMSQELLAIAPAAPLASALELMVERHVHRVLVVDRRRRLEGLITSTDLLAALQRAANLAGS